MSQFSTPLNRRYGDNQSGHPWDVSAKVVVGLREARRAKSSAWVMAGAAELLDEGVRMLKGMKDKDGKPGCAMLRDSRSMHFEHIDE